MLHACSRVDVTAAAAVLPQAVPAPVPLALQRLSRRADDNHLWQDLGLGSRSELSALMARWFPALVAKNAFDMKWKKFLYRQLCEREQLLICRSPSCAVCSDHDLCFGPES